MTASSSKVSSRTSDKESFIASLILLEFSSVRKSASEHNALLPDFPQMFKDPKWRRFIFEKRGQLSEEVMSLKQEFDAFFFPWALERTKAELWPHFQKYGVISAPSNTIEDVFNCPHLKERGYWLEIDHPEAGKLKYPGRPFIMNDTPWQLKRRAPLLGEHNQEIYGRLGYSKEDMVILEERGVI